MRPHRHDAIDGTWQHCATPECSVVFYLGTDVVDADSVVARVGSKANDRPTPVCFCFAHTADDLVADAAAHGGVSAIKAEIKQAVAEGHCACEHLNPSSKCCLSDVHRTLKVAGALKVTRLSTADPYDLIVIGAGMAGTAAAEKCARAGWRVAIVDDLPYGGTCALRGCDPKKILRRGAEIIDAAHLLTGKGINPGGMRIDWPALSAHMHGFTDPVPTNMETGLARHGVDTLHGTARFTGADRLEIDGTSHQFRHALIATGARPRPLDLPGADHLIDSTDFLYLDQLPDRILFVGGGFISFEFAHIAARAGRDTMIVDHGPRPLRGFDPDLVDLLVARSAAVGIDIHRATEIVGIQATSDGFDVKLDDHGRHTTITVDLVVHGAGRRPDLTRLDLDTGDIAHGERGVTVAGHLQSTTNPRIYAAGDAADTPGAPLTPVAVFEGKVAASNMLKGATTTPDYTGIATAVFTIPELTRVGLLEHEARDAGIDVDVRYTDTSGWYSNYRIGESTAATKILIDRTTDTIVGAHMLGPEYGELINICALAIKLGLTTRQLKSMTAAYPTVGSDLGSML